ncbi:MAG: hypothetical protein MK226_16740 [Saprospiraceae bacterium]|nr:hypothetical protein [Saprospiraceae bacterium]
MTFKTRLLPIAFILVLILHFVDQLFELIPEPKVVEQRKLAEMPIFNISHLDPFPKDFEPYYNDHFKWKNYFVQANNYLNYYTFKKSALPEQVVVGKNGWLFKGGHQLDVHRGKFQLSEKELQQTVQEILRRKNEIEAMGAKFYLSIAPLKANIYPEYLPDNTVPLNPSTYTQQLIHAIQEEGITYIDLFDLMASLKEEQLLYLKTDHHWNNFASKSAAGYLLKRIRQDFPSLPEVDLKDFRTEQVEYDGMSLAQMIGMEEVLKDTFVILHGKENKQIKALSHNYPIPHDFPFKEEYIVKTKTEGSELPKVMVARESFASPFTKIFPHYFSETIFLFDNWKHDFHPNIIQQEQPDIYLHLIWEGLLFQMIKPDKDNISW